MYKYRLGAGINGKDAHQIEDTWQYLYKGAYWRRGPITITAISGIDMALWNLKDKASGLPVYKLIGGKGRSKIKVYGHANGSSIEEILANLGKLIDQGYKAVRLQCAIPGLDSTYGILADKKDYFELQSSRSLPSEQPWSTTKYLNFIPKLFREARKQYGGEVELLHEMHSRLTPIEASRLAKSLEPYNLLFLEDAVTFENQSNYKVVRSHTTIPLAVGEIFNPIWDAK